MSALPPPDFAPSPADEARLKSKRRWLMAGIVTGGLGLLGPIIGLLGTVLGMLGAFRVLGESGIGDPRALAAHIGDTLLFTATGLFVFPFGIVLFTVCLVFYLQLRPKKAPPLPQDFKE